MLIKIGCGGVDIRSLDSSIWNAIKIISKIWKEEEIVITSTWEGTHLPWSKHYQGKAIDIRYPILSKTMIDEIRSELGKDYDIIVKRDHIHIEYDPKG